MAMGASELQEIGSFAAVVLPVVGGAIWLVKKLFDWFTQTLDKEADERSRLTTELITVMKQTHEEHREMIKALNEGRAASVMEHQKIMECMNVSAGERR